MSAREKPEAGDGALWRAAMRHVTPLPGRDQPSRRSVPATAAPPRSAPSPAPTRAPEPALAVLAARKADPPLAHFAGLDRATAERLKRGRRAIEARLDLHGMTQAEAHAALSGFIVRSQADGRRCVLVITGRGRASPGGGVLKEAVPRWLDGPRLRPHILATAPAQPRHGGNGAIYVLLRRLREGA